MSEADSLIGPRVSTTIGWKGSLRQDQNINFLVAANSATDLASLAAEAT